MIDVTVKPTKKASTEASIVPIMVIDNAADPPKRIANRRMVKTLNFKTRLILFTQTSLINCESIYQRLFKLPS
jgi:hypothetical protein